MTRAPGSTVRQNILKILDAKPRLYGYELHKYYLDLFPKVTLRNIYYHLRKGVELGEITLHEVKEEKGNFSWGTNVQKIYYSIGGNAKLRSDKRVKEYFAKR